MLNTISADGTKLAVSHTTTTTAAAVVGSGTVDSVEPSPDQPAQVYVCVDCSGSTGGSTLYWSTVLSLLQANAGAKGIIYWDTRAEQMDLEKASEWATARRGGGGTQPECFAAMVPPGAHLILVTDGQVGSYSVQRCDEILEERQFRQVDVYFVNTGGQMNLSVSAPFTRKTRYNIVVDGKLISAGSSEKSVELAKYFDQPDLFVAEADEVLKQIVMKSLGKENPALRNEVLALQRNLLKCVSERNSPEEALFAQLRDALRGGDYSASMELLRSTIGACDSSAGHKIEAMCQQLIQYCSGTLYDCSFDLLQPGRLVRAGCVKAVPTEEVAAVEDYQGAFQCPIVLATEMPCLLVKAGEPVLNELEKNLLDALITNPLLLLQNAELVQKLRQRLDHPIGLEALKKMFELDGVVHSPFTRAEISCALSLGEHLSHTRATNFALANLLFGAKLVGQAELWLAVVYFVVAQTGYLAQKAEFMEALRANLLHRLRTGRTNITLSGLPIEPVLKCPVDIALWYCVCSARIYHGADEDVRNRLRSLGSAARHLVALVELLQYPFERQWTRHRLALYSAFGWMMRQAKTAKSQWRTMLRCQYQGCVVLEDGTIVPVDGPPTAERVALPSFKAFDEDGDLPLGELLALAALVDTSKSTSAVPIPLVLAASDVPAPKTNYGYSAEWLLRKEVVLRDICPHTMRPYVIDRQKREHWKKCAEELYGPLAKQLSAYNYFNKYVSEHLRYPSMEQFIGYMAQKQANRQDGNAMDTLPTNVRTMVQGVFGSFAAALGGDQFEQRMAPEEFKRRVSASMTEESRAQLDGSNQM